MNRPAHLVRQIGLWSGVAVLVGSTIGSGIFKTPSGIATKVPSPLPMLGVWVAGGLCVLCGALALSEVGGAFPYSGGIYVYIREAYGRLAAFLFGWAQLILLRPSSVGAVAIVFGQYALRLTGMQDGSPHFNELSAALAIGAILCVSTANILGVKFGTGIQNVTTIAKTAGLLVLVVLALTMALPHASTHFVSAGGASPSLSKFGLALVSVLWAYDGWADGSYVSGEVKDPRKNVPRAILIGTLLVIGVYLLANVAYLSVFSITEMAHSKIIAADAMAKLIGEGGVTLIVATVMISTFGTLNGSVLTSPRVFFAMAEDRLFFEPMSRVHPRFHTPYVSVGLCGSLGILYVVAATVMSGSEAFGTLTDAFVIGIVPFYALAVGSIFVFRRRAKLAPAAISDLSDSLVDPVRDGQIETHPHAYAPPVRAALYPLTPALFILSTLFLLANSLLDLSSRIPTLITLGILLVGIPVYFGTIGRRAAPAKV